MWFQIRIVPIGPSYLNLNCEEKSNTSSLLFFAQSFLLLFLVFYLKKSKPVIHPLLPSDYYKIQLCTQDFLVQNCTNGLLKSRAKKLTIHHLCMWCFKQEICQIRSHNHCAVFCHDFSKCKYFHMINNYVFLIDLPKYSLRMLGDIFEAADEFQAGTGLDVFFIRTLNHGFRFWKIGNREIYKR